MLANEVLALTLTLTLTLSKARREFDAAEKRKAEEAKAKEAARPPTLSGLSFKVAQGDFVGVCGPVGSGKSSLLASILGDTPRL